MKYSQARLGRTFVIRLEDGEILHEEIERFARVQSVRAAALILVGGSDAGSKLVVGPEKGREVPVIPMYHLLDEVHETLGTGTLFPDDGGEPILHMHVSCGRKNSSVAGCIREGLKVWRVMEVILFELVDTTGARKPDPETGLKLLEP